MHKSLCYVQIKPYRTENEMKFFSWIFVGCCFAALKASKFPFILLIFFHSQLKWIQWERGEVGDEPLRIKKSTTKHRTKETRRSCCVVNLWNKFSKKNCCFHRASLSHREKFSAKQSQNIPRTRRRQPMTTMNNKPKQ